LLCKAIENEDILKVLHILINIRKNLNELSMIEGRKQTVLHHACAKSNPEIVELLLRNGCNVNQEDQDHCKPIDCAMCAHKVR